MASLIKILDNAKFLSKTVFGEVSAPQPPTYAIGRSLSAVNEGSSVTFTLSTTNVSNGTVLPYTISGISSNDVTTGSLTGSFTVNSGLATATITMSADQLTEGAETATLTLNNTAASNFVLVNDTSVWTPNLISGLQLWLDAADSSTLFDATAGGSLVTTDGAAVARWADKSGNNRHATQATANARPLLKTSIKNGKNVLRFDGANDQLVGVPCKWDGQVTVFYVAKTNNNAGYVFYDGSGNTNNDAFHFGWNAGKPTVYGNGWGSGRTPNASSGVSYTGSFIMTSSVLGSSSSIFVNGATPTGSSVANGSLSQAANNNYVIGYETYWWFNGDISEILIYNSALTTTQRQAVETYLNTKWALY